MRMRRKKWARPELDASSFFIKDNFEHIGKWKEVFKNPINPIHLELGCGKGVFLKDIAFNNPDINYIAIDISSDVLGCAKRNVESVYNEANRSVDNVCLVSADIERILEMMNSDDQIERVYINFCNPWPKDRHKKRRLTHTRKLTMYKQFVSRNAELHFKTDDDELFEETLEYLKECDMPVIYKTYDLHNSDYKDKSYSTEHEEMFTKDGIPTKFLIAKFFND
ncbi:MAG: tRNA (guanosine(46)-N7)-methyltransferase TrmB [Clostridia bacterium]|nr:tRNA (guanosine(46)-N7)-methyltransferase TrmB [Clostridia bacterium]